MLVPIIETERLRLRAHDAADFPGVAALWADPIVTRHIGGSPSTQFESWRRLLVYAGLWQTLGYGYWAVEEKGGGFIGDVGLADFKREMEPSIAGVPEVGWVLAPYSHGKGYATEAVRAVLSWSDAQLPVARTVCIIDPLNLASIRVAIKCGFREVERTTYKGSPTILFERIALSS